MIDFFSSLAIPVCGEEGNAGTTSDSFAGILDGHIRNTWLKLIFSSLLDNFMDLVLHVAYRPSSSSSSFPATLLGILL